MCRKEKFVTRHVRSGRYCDSKKVLGSELLLAGNDVYGYAMLTLDW